MPLYYFDVADNGKTVTDHFGVELDDLYEAREQAIALLPDMARNELPDGDRHEFAAVVRCSGGRVRYEARLVFHGRWVEPPTYPSVARDARVPLPVMGDVAPVVDGSDAPREDRGSEPESSLRR